MGETLFKNFRDKLERTLITAATTLTGGGNQAIDCDTSGGAFTVTLPNASEAAWSIFTVRKIGGGTNALTVAVKTGELALKQIAATALATMEDDDDRAAFLSDGLAWHCIAQKLND